MRTSDAAASIDALDWREDHVVFADIVLRLEDAPANSDPEVRSIAFFKTRELVDEFRRFFDARPEFAPRRIFELGIWDGGSVVFWNEVLEPEKLVAVDLADRGDDPLFSEYVAARSAGDRIETYWRTDQRDKPRLRELAGRFRGPLDLVVDDASHTYAPTRASFEALFPLLRAGGIYVIEDWAWGHWPDFQSSDHPWRAKTPLTRFVQELVELQGSAPGLLAGVTVNHGFVAVERGSEIVDYPADFNLDRHIVRLG